MLMFLIILYPIGYFITIYLINIDFNKVMFYYIYYSYVAGYTCYKIYEYLELARKTYTVGTYTYNTVSGIYEWIKPVEHIELDDLKNEWDMCDNI